MNGKLDPNQLFERIVHDIPANLHAHLFVTGSLAAAYHFQTRIAGRAVNTKDADLVVHPAGDVLSCRQMSEQLLAAGWTRTSECFAATAEAPANNLRAIRLYPPNSFAYFIEFLNLPELGQREPLRWLPLELSDGWYALPTFRFMGLVSLNRLRSSTGLEYAAPSMMALANLLSHPTLGIARMESGMLRGILRSAKDLGRVLALAWLAGPSATESWLEPWIMGLQTYFPGDWKDLASCAGEGMQELLENPTALDEARQTTEYGLLNGLRVTSDQLRITGERLFMDTIEPLRDRGKHG